MPAPVPAVLRAGAVFRYAYLWHREFLAGQTEARYDRPALALAIAIHEKDGRSHVLALPVTHSQPIVAHHGVLLPAQTKKVLGLDAEPSWVVTTEAARFAWPGADVRLVPHRRTPFYGYVSLPFLRSVAQSFLNNRKNGETVSFERYE